MRTIRHASILSVALATIAACGGKSFSVIDAAQDGGSPDANSPVVDGGSCHPAEAPACPWNGCLGGPNATCGADLQWHCPRPPTSCADASVIDSGPFPLPVPDNHRPDDSACRIAPPPGNCLPSPGGDKCTADTQCTQGSNGRCGYALGGGDPYCTCSYDTCADDSACPSGELCACHGSPYVGGGNGCAPGNCRVDSDCGAGGYCSPAVDPNSCGSLLGYYCRTPYDQCTNDSDCSSGPFSSCTFQPKTSRWECQQVGACASVGVDGPP